MAKKEVNLEKNKMKADAIKKITEHNRDYLTGKVKIPINSPALKNVHTNQFLFMDLPEQMELDNWDIIAKALSENVNRYIDYKTNRLYIEGVDIKVQAGGKAEMELSINAFPSSLSSYAEKYKEYEKNLTSTNNQTDKDKSNAIAGNNSTVQNGWWGSWVTEMVKKNVGNETDTLRKCKKMYQVFCDHIYYSLYCNAPKTCSGANSFESAWNKNGLNCGDGANILSAFLECCGAKVNILNGSGCGYGHFVLKVTINGSTYWCDHASNSGQHTVRGWGNTFCDIRSGSDVGTHIEWCDSDC